MGFRDYGCIICRVNWHSDVKCFLCDDRVCNQTGRVYDGEFFCKRCWDAGSLIRPALDEEIDRTEAIQKTLWDNWRARTVDPSPAE